MMRGIARAAILETLRRKPVAQYEPASRTIWLLRPDHLGDLLFLRPALHRFRHQLPDWHVTLAIGPWSRAVVEDVTDVDEIVEIPFPGFSRSAPGGMFGPYELLFQQAERVRATRPAAVVILRDDHWWGALLARMAGVPVIIGASRPEMHGLATDAVRLNHTHAVAQNIEMLDFAAQRLCGLTSEQTIDARNNPLTWTVTHHDRERARSLLAATGIEPPYVAIHPGSGAPVKLWPAERWGRVAEDLASRGYGVVLTGSEREKPLLAEVAARAAVPIPSLGGQTSVHDLAALFDGADLVTGVDSGPLHLAVAVSTPTLHIYGPSDVARYGPWGDPRRHRVVRMGWQCPACGDLSPARPEGVGCMTAIGEDTAIDAIRGLLRDDRGQFTTDDWD